MDGNRRWATSRGLPTLLGHKEGVTAVKTVVAFCLEHSISYLSLYTFSLENFKRSMEEKCYLFSLIEASIHEYTKDLINQDIRIYFVGDRSLFPRSLQSICNAIEEKTAAGKRLQLHILFCYGGQQEVVNCVQKIAQQVASGSLAADAITHQDVRNNLWMPAAPDPDLIIRTGAVNRISNFLLFQAAYSELMFLDCMWPDMSKERFEKALQEFSQRQRRFGS